MSAYSAIVRELPQQPRKWLVTGAAGFIGSNLVEQLLRLGQTVVGLDNFATGHRHNVDDVIAAVGTAAKRFRFVEGDIRDLDTCRSACDGIDVVVHEAAIGSVPRSVEDPLRTHQANIDGFLNMLIAARDARTRRFVYAASSSTYGDHPGLPKVESQIGRPLSPYAVTKYVNELYAGVFERTYGMSTVGLRYFNVFGRRQDPNGAYAAVIPRWIGGLLQGNSISIFGDGETSRDFCYIDNVIQANLLAALTELPAQGDRVYNVGYGGQTSLTRLFELLRSEVSRHVPTAADSQASYLAFRAGDVRHSRADISKIRSELGYEATHSLAEGLSETVDWFAQQATFGGSAAGVAHRSAKVIASRRATS